MEQVIVITGASSGFGALTARALANAGHIVYAGMRETTGRNTVKVKELEAFAEISGVKISALEMDVLSQTSVDNAIAQVEKERGQIDVIIHNAGHMVSGAAEAFTPEQLAQLYDVNVLSTQRVNRAALPGMRKRQAGLILWVSSSSVKGGTPPFLSPYFAAKAGMDSLAVSYAGELAQFGIETSIIVPGAFTKGTNHFANSGHPADTKIQAEYDAKYPDLMENIGKKLAEIEPADADPSSVAAEIVRIISLLAGERPYRVHVDPTDDGSKAVSDIADQNRIDFLNRIGLADFLKTIIQDN
ncbi:D-beta-hydroxybutyrate dehydrogenase [Listeria grayi]|uniref:D-beta-hydroxybutyrate dehydrogenase n=1 Tax=Listeria grayi TaxID=1641 RepID=A0A378MGT7_LISGR|nr:SDR family oxidoreductase [Listeria grayi]STY44592.1 D-beta-hydroxybutyrate dehydrogenase [Listeria grayi]